MIRKFSKQTILFFLWGAPLWSFGQDLVSGMSGTLWYAAPASEWLEALPVGNGRLGAMVFGDPKRERIQLNEDSMWPGASDWGDAKGTPGDLEQYRRLLSIGHPHSVDSTYMDRFSYKSVIRSHQTMGDLYIDFQGDREVQNYRRSLSMDSALVSVSYASKGESYSENVFSSSADDVLVVHLSTNAEEGMQFDLRLNRPKDHDHETVKIVEVSNSEISMQGMVTQYGGLRESKPLEIDYGVKFETRLKVIQDAGQVTVANGKLTLLGAKEVTLLIVCNTSFYGDDYVQRNIETIEKLEGKHYSELLERHLEDYSQLYDRVKINLGGNTLDSLPVDVRLDRMRAGHDDSDLAAKLFQFGRYLLISSSRPGSSPANLQGLWNENIEAPWNADYHLNINLQMNYWPAEVTNLSECSIPLLDFGDRLLTRGRKTAQEQYGIARGAVMHHATDLWAPAWMRSERTYWGAWIHGGGWLAQHYWERYQFTQDEEFLQERGYPFLKAISEFYLDWLQKDEKSGKWISFPETSPENSYVAEDGQPAASVMGSSMGHQIIAEAFRNTVKAATVLKVDDQFVEEVRSKAKDLYPGLIIGPDGRLLEWSQPYEEAEEGHRHMSHLYGLYPGDAIKSVDKDLLNAAQKSIDFRLQNGAAGIGWSRVWMLNFNARLRDADSAEENIREFLKNSVSDNLFDLIFEGLPPFQMEGNCGFTAGVAELLMQSHEGVVNVLPALPQNWDQGAIYGLVARGNIEVDIRWEHGRLLELGILAKKDGKVDVEYESTRISMDLSKYEKIWLDGNLELKSN